MMAKTESQSTIATAIVVIILVLSAYVLIAATGYSIGYNFGVKLMQREAVEKGVAEWEVIDNDGTSEFRWKLIENNAVVESELIL